VREGVGCTIVVVVVVFIVHASSFFLFLLVVVHPLVVHGLEQGMREGDGESGVCPLEVPSKPELKGGAPVPATVTLTRAQSRNRCRRRRRRRRRCCFMYQVRVERRDKIERVWAGTMTGGSGGG